MKGIENIQREFLKVLNISREVIRMCFCVISVLLCAQSRRAIITQWEIRTDR